MTLHSLVFDRGLSTERFRLRLLRPGHSLPSLVRRQQ